jgi:hypothetical protein
MPRDRFMPLTGDEQRFVFHICREGGAPEKASVAERRARLKKGEGAVMLKRRHVAEEIQRRMGAILFEENRLIAKGNVAAAAEEAERDRVTLSNAERALARVINLDAKSHGSVILEAVRLALVYTGTIKDGNRERIGALKSADGSDPVKANDGVYRSIFDSMREGEAYQVSSLDEPAPLIPGDMPPDLPVIGSQAAPPAPKTPPAPAAAAVTPVPEPKPTPPRVSPAKPSKSLKTEIDIVIG